MRIPQTISQIVLVQTISRKSYNVDHLWTPHDLYAVVELGIEFLRSN